MRRLLIIALLLFITSCVPNNSYCPEEEATYAHNKLGEIYQLYSDKMESHQFFWDMGYSIETKQIQEINKIKMLAVNLKTPECLDKAKYYMIDSMSAVEGALHLAQVGDIQGMTEQLIEGSRLVSLADQELLEFRRCMPDCKK